MAETIVQALLAERHGYILRDLPDRVAQVDAELARYGIEAEAPEKATAESKVETATPARPRARKPKG